MNETQVYLVYARRWARYLWVNRDPHLVRVPLLGVVYAFPRPFFFFINFPASRDLFSFCVREVDEYGSMRGGYLETEPSRDTSCCVGPLNNNGITVKECAGLSGLKSQSANISWGMRFEQCRLRLWTAVVSKWVSTHGRGFFHIFVSPVNAKEKRSLLAGNS